MAETGFDLLSMLFPQQEQDASGQQPPAQAPAGDAPPPQAAGGWQQYLSDPANRAFMISAGLQMATGGWGNWGQQMAQAMGKGAEAATGTQQIAFEQGEKEKEVKRRGAEAAAGRQTQLQVAKIGATSREEVARARIEGMLQRTQMNVQAKPGQEQKIWNDTYQNTLKGKDKDQFLTGKSDEEVEAVATQRADRALAHWRTTGQAAGTPEGKNPPKVEAPAVTPAKPKAASKTQAQIEADWTELQGRPGFEQRIKTPEGRAKMKEEKPHLWGKIKEAEGNQQLNKSLDYFRQLFGIGGESGSSR